MATSSSDPGSKLNLSFQEKIDKMTSPMKFNHKRGWLLLIGACIAFIVFYTTVTRSSSSSSIKKMSVEPDVLQTRQRFWYEGYTVWPEFRSEPVITHQYFQNHCVKTADRGMSQLSDIGKEWSSSTDKLCRSFYDKFKSIYSIEFRKATLSFPDKFYTKVKGWLGNKPELIAELPSQTVIHMINKFTREHTIFNPLRDKRPVAQIKIETDLKYFNDIVSNSSATCDFCNFREMTAEHPFGRIESQHSFTASNVFKLDKLHALIALKQHNPLVWKKEQFMDVMALTVTWLEKAKHHNPEAKYPSLIWDVLPHCGASQVHPHIHVMFDPAHYQGGLENWRRGAQDYFNLFDSNYFTDLLNINTALNLTVAYGEAVAFANIVPRKDHEIVIMAKEANEDFFQLIYYVLRGFVDDLHKFCYSMSLAYPGLGASEGKIPAFARVITRGSVTELRNDMSSLEIFTATNVNIDPWKTKRILEDSLRQRAPPKK